MRRRLASGLMRRALHLAGSMGIAAIASVPPAFGGEEPCDVPAELIRVEATLPHLSETLRTGNPVKIVAIGGASTTGAAAGSLELAYPHRLQEILNHWYPTVPITVVNKGVPRQSARQNLERFPTDVFAEDPVMVIWETGINDAVRGTDIDEFAETLQMGVDELKSRAIDIVMVDMQFSKSSSALINFEAYLKALHRVGDLAEVYVLPRHAMMHYWSEQNVFNFDDVAPEDRAKLAARVYDCLGRKMAGIIQHAVQ